MKPNAALIRREIFSSEKTFDIVMANPPFMSPKGGIKPHKKFSINANRSEVLFVDYIAEHIHPTSGRAGIIVPEGIIFQSANAYRDLRKMLVEKKFLYAVVSLPAGVFQPYSGVKTSVLLMDKTLAAKTDKILFVKIANDGFGLGAQRKELKTSDLPDALNLIRDFQAAILQGGTSRLENIEEMPASAVAVEKTTIAANGDYNLSADRYKLLKIHNSKFEFVTLNEVCDVITDGTHQTPTYAESGFIFLSSKNVTSRKIDWENVKYIPEELHNSLYKRLAPKLNDVLLAKNGTTGVAALVDKDLVFDIYVSLALLRPSEKIMPKFLLHCINSERLKEQFDSHLKGVGVPNLHLKDIREATIPLPPLSIQKEIVEKIEFFQRIIDGAKQVVAGYKPQIDIQPDWEMVGLGEVCEIKRGKFSHRPRNAPQFYGGEYPFIQTGDVVKANGGKIPFTQTLNDLGLTVSKLFKPTIVLITIAANIGDTAITKRIDKLASREILFDLQNDLLINPKRGDVIEGTSGARKARIGDKTLNRGKSGSFRYIYVYFENVGIIYLLLFYGKNEQANLNSDEKKFVASFIRQAKDNHGEK